MVSSKATTIKYLEKKAKGLQKSLSEMTLAEMDVYWDEAKKL